MKAENLNYKNGIIKSIPKKWTDKEIELLLSLKNKGFNNQEIAEHLDRTKISVQIKLKRLTKKDNTYNKKHITEKYHLNKLFYYDIKPKSILDLYAGQYSFYSSFVNCELITNDINKEFTNNTFNVDSLKLLCMLYYKNQKYDLIDLDPFGSCYDCLDLAIKMSNKGLIVTLGEMGHKRWKRLDYVRRYYNIQDLENFTSNNIVKEIQKIGIRNKKNLKVKYLKDWNNISRVYFTIEELKITEQWRIN